MIGYISQQKVCHVTEVLFHFVIFLVLIFLNDVLSVIPFIENRINQIVVNFLNTSLLRGLSLPL